MGEKRLNPSTVFLLVLLIAVGVFLLYSRLTFTGYVTSEYFSGSANLNDFSNLSIFENTKLEVDAVVLDNLSLPGSYISPFFAAPNDTEVIWYDFASDVWLNPSTSSVVFYYRACNVDVNCTEDFIPTANSTAVLMGKYFQYMVEMQTSGNSPTFYGVSIKYHTPLDLPISMESPQNITYNTETVLVEIIANGSIWFYNGTDNETYTAPVNKTFSQGSHVLIAWVTDAYGNTNSTSVAFSVWLLQPYYRFADNACSVVNLILPEKTANDYANLSECESHITTSSTTEEENLPLTTETTEECTPDWVCGDWGECIDGTQTRVCTDMSTCTTVSEPPPQTQSCTGGIVTTQPETETPSTTEETPKKGFLRTVGSAIATPFSFVFSNRTRIFVFSGVLLLVIAGFLVFKFSLKTRLKVLKLLNIRKKREV
jgi:hypothetical protein